MVQSPTRPRARGNRPVEARTSGLPCQVDAPLPARYAPDAMLAAESRSLLSTMAHEIRGPLSAVALSSELLIEDLDALNADQVRSLAQRIHRGTIWLQGLIENILCDAAIRDDRLDLHLEPTDLMDVVHDATELLQPLLASRSQELRVVLDSAIPLVRADRRRVGQVIINLVLNASKFSPSGSPVTITLSVFQSAVRVSVTDRGPGLDVDSESLFDRYYRSAQARTAGIAGTGLGLAIVKTIVESHGGSVGATNRPDGGAHFWFDIPVDVA